MTLQITISRRRLVALAAASAAVPFIAVAQSALDSLPKGSLRDHAIWFVGVLNDAGYDLSADEVGEHFTSDFLAQIPADQVIDTFIQLRPVLGEVTIGRIAKGSDEI